MPVLPGHRYIGPGNQLNNGHPIDDDDRIAQQHDHRYDNAKDFNDVRDADRDAIHQFWSDALHNWNLHSAIGAAGLGIKYGAESVFGQIYPSKNDMDAKRKAEERLGRENGVKQHKGDEEVHDMEADMNHNEVSSSTDVMMANNGSGASSGPGQLGDLFHTGPNLGYTTWNMNASAVQWYKKRTTQRVEQGLPVGTWQRLHLPLSETSMQHLWPYDEFSQVVGTNTVYSLNNIGEGMAFDRYKFTFHDIVLKLETTGAGVQLINPLAIECMWMDEDFVPAVEGGIHYNNVNTFPLTGTSISGTYNISTGYPWMHKWVAYSTSGTQNIAVAWKVFKEMYSNTPSHYYPNQSTATVNDKVMGLTSDVQKTLWIRLATLPFNNGDAATKVTMCSRLTREVWGRARLITQVPHQRVAPVTKGQDAQLDEIIRLQELTGDYSPISWAHSSPPEHIQSAEEVEDTQYISGDQLQSRTQDHNKQIRRDALARAIRRLSNKLKHAQTSNEKPFPHD